MELAEIERINQELRDLSPAEPPAGEVRIDAHHRTFIEFPESFAWPRITVTGITADEAKQAVSVLVRKIPSFIAGCSLLPVPHPSKESGFLHFVRAYELPSSDYIYICKVNCDYLGGANDAEVIAPASQGRTPAIKTNRIYFSGLILAAEKIKRENGWITSFQSRHLKEAIFQVRKKTEDSEEAHRELFTAMLFDDVDFSRQEEAFIEIFSQDKEWSAGKLLKPLTIEYLSLCLNLPYPFRELVDACAPRYQIALNHFLGSGSMVGLREEQEKFWAEFYSAWKLESAVSRSGNTQWKIANLPDKDWALGLIREAPLFPERSEPAPIIELDSEEADERDRRRLRLGPDGTMEISD